MAIPNAFRNMQMPPTNLVAGVLRTIGLAGAAVYGVSNSLMNVEGGHRAVVFNKVTGMRQSVYGEGTHLIVPWFDVPVMYDVRARPHQVQSTSGTKDLQMVNISLRVLTRPLPDKLPQTYVTLGQDYAERVLPSIVHETMKSVIAQYNAAQLLTMREAVSSAIRRDLERRASHFNVALDDVSITQLSFSREYTAAVEAKQVAQQEAERARFVVDKAEQEKQSAIIKAEGEAMSAKLIGEACKNNSAFLTLRKIEAARDIADTVATSNNKLFLGSGSLMLDLKDLQVPKQK
mmetsp:Transcript_13290/g.48387  ORF Transcript_13290/g.48387 Transcript_13290/m.48387 type:complete len:290 (-) Transcript_13290:149-1018(-)